MKTPHLDNAAETHGPSAVNELAAIKRALQELQDLIRVTAEVINEEAHAPGAAAFVTSSMVQIVERCAVSVLVA